MIVRRVDMSALAVICRLQVPTALTRRWKFAWETWYAIASYVFMEISSINPAVNRLAIVSGLTSWGTTYSPTSSRTEVSIGFQLYKARVDVPSMIHQTLLDPSQRDTG